MMQFSPIMPNVTQSRNSRILVLQIDNGPDCPPQYVTKFIVSYLQEVFTNIERYVGTIDDGKLILYFPEIIVNSNPLYNTIIDELVVMFKRNQIEINRHQISIVIAPEPLLDSDPELSEGDLNDRVVDAKEIRDAEELPTSPNTLLNRVDEFELLMMYIDNIHDQDKQFVLDNLLYLSSAYYRNEKTKCYNLREEQIVSRNKWIELMSRYDIDPDLAGQYFDESRYYSYSTISMEEIVHRYSRGMAKMINAYREARVKQKIKALFNFNLYKFDPSDNDLWKVMAEYVRKDHFYADGSIYVFDENHNRKIVSSEMRSIINTFITYVKEVKLSLTTNLQEQDKSGDIEKYNIRYSKIVRPFENKVSAKFVADAIENYNHTKLRNEIMKKATTFQDTVTVYDNNKLTMRKALMEDQFTTAASVPVLGFGKTDAELNAIADVRKAFKQIFVYDENVRWFFKWCGSLLTHKPERCVLIMYGPKGGNAKTTIANVLLKIFQGWAIQCRPDMLAPGGKASGATPFEVELINMILAVFSEPKKGIKYCSSTVKDISGGDRKKGAAKYKDPIEFEQTAKIMILCNAIPEFDEVDEALLDRIYILKCIGRYVKETDRIDPDNHIYERDDTFWQNPLRIRAFAHLIVHEGFHMYAQEGLCKTQLQKDELNHWRKDTCPYMRFLDQTQEFFEGKKVYCQGKEVYYRFKLKNPTITMPYEDFVAKFSEVTGVKPKKFEHGDYYPFYVHGCSDMIKLTEGQKMPYVLGKEEN